MRRPGILRHSSLLDVGQGWCLTGDGLARLQQLSARPPGSPPTGPQGDQAYRAAVDFLKGSPCPTAVVARNDLTALAVVDTATDLGLQVPGGPGRDQHILPPTLVVRRPCGTVPGSGKVGGPRAGIGRR